MNVMNLIQNNYEEAIAMILFGIGFSNLLLQQNQSDPGRACTDGHRRIRIGDCTHAFSDDPAVPKVSYLESR